MSEQNVIEVKPISTDIVDQFADDAQGYIKTANDITIKTQPDYEFAAGVLKAVKEKAKTLEEERKKITVPIDNAKKAVQALFKRPQEVIAQVESILKGKLLGYTEEQERKQREEQARLDRIAEQERKKKEEQERAWREKEEAARREAERLEAEGKAEEAKKAKEAADKAAEKAEERAIEADSVVAPIAAPKVDKVKGMSYREVWSAEVTDFAKLPDEYKLPNQTMLNKMATATKGAVPIPGVKFTSRKVLASGS